MNRKAYTVFLCTLLASSFVHDFNVRASTTPTSLLDLIRTTPTSLPPGCSVKVVCEHETTPPTDVTTQSTDVTTPSTDVTTQSTNVTTPSTDVTTEPPKDPSAILRAVANADANLLAIINGKAKVGLIIDVNNNIAGLIDAENIQGVIIDLEAKSGVYLLKKDTFIETEDLQEFLKTLTTGLKPLLEIESATKFKVSTASQDILKTVNNIVKNLIPSLEEELQAKPKVGLELVIAISSKLVKLLQGPLKGVLQLLGSTGVSHKEDLAGIVNCVEVLGSIIGALPGGVSGLGKAGVQIDLQVLAEKEDGFQRLAYIFEAVGTKIDLAAALGDLLNNPKTALNVIAKISGNSNEGVNGLIKVTSKLIGFIKKVVKLEELLNVIIQFLGANKEKDGKEISNKAVASIDILLKAIDKAGVSEDLSDFVDTLTKLKDDKYKLDGVDVSSILQAVVAGLAKPKDLLGVLVLVLNLLSPIVGLVESLPTLLIVLIINLNSVLGLGLLKTLGLLLNLVLGPVVGLVGGLLSVLLGTVTSLLGFLLQDIIGALGSLPVVGQLVSALEDALKGAGIKKSLKSLLGSNPESANLIKALLQELGKLKLGASPEAIKKVQETVKNCGTLNVHLGITLDVAIVA